jgi:hypothetical protein
MYPYQVSQAEELNWEDNNHTPHKMAFLRKSPILIGSAWGSYDQELCADCGDGRIIRTKDGKLIARIYEDGRITMSRHLHEKLIISYEYNIEVQGDQ